MVRIIRRIREVLRAPSQLPPHGLATAREIFHQRVQRRRHHGAALGRHRRRSSVVQNDLAERLLQRRHPAQWLEHRHRRPELGHRPAVRVVRDESPRDEQRQRHLHRQRESGAELWLADRGASGGAAPRAVELVRQSRHERDGRGVRLLGVPGRYVQHELPGGRVEHGEQQRHLQLNGRIDGRRLHAT